MGLNEGKLNELLGKVVGDLSAGYGGVMVSLGDKLGLYKAMKGAGPLSSHEVAKRSGCAERYVREWLNSQVAAGYIDYHPKSAHLRAERRAGLCAGGGHLTGVHSDRLAGRVLDVVRRAEGAQVDPQRGRRPVGRARRAAVLRGGGVLPQRLSRQPGRRMAAGAQWRHGEARARRQGRRRRLRPRPFDGADGAGLSELQVLGLRRPSRLDRHRTQGRAGGGRRRPGDVRGRGRGRLPQARTTI